MLAVIGLLLHPVSSSPGASVLNLALTASYRSGRDGERERAPIKHRQNCMIFSGWAHVTQGNLFLSAFKAETPLCGVKLIADPVPSCSLMCWMMLASGYHPSGHITHSSAEGQDTAHREKKKKKHVFIDLCQYLPLICTLYRGVV